MQTVRSREQLAQALAPMRGGTVALVPTMGALHAGHLKLIAEARKRADAVAATIFVNPLQFGANEDLGRYPRREADDARLLGAAECDLLWLPAVEDIYPAGFATMVSVKGVADRWEGEARPGHFDGVATVVAKLLIAVAPDVALFGEKDFQQLAVIRHMAVDLGLPVSIVGVETVRDRDGLALSSRNAYLSAVERGQAIALPQTLIWARDAIGTGADVARTLAAAKLKLVEAGFLKIDYLALVDALTLDPLDAPLGTMRLLAAATIGSTRLIDNVAVERPR
ncbi:MAG: pantoate--beta-alanine ligase [Pseudomonadota bacterium]|nr:pantoate--beta-alanine ligase [Pseudomonadota bacterium]